MDQARVPTLIYGLSFWFISLPIAWWFGVRLGQGVPALMWSLFAGLAVATLLLAWRFHGLSLRIFAAAEPVASAGPSRA